MLRSQLSLKDKEKAMAVWEAKVKMKDGSTYTVKRLLANGDTNTKMRKSNAFSKEYYTVGLSLSPARESGYEVCASRSPGCTKACLFTAGYGVYQPVKNARIAKTRLFFQDRLGFITRLKEELRLANRKAIRKGKILACRLNVVSDLPWEKLFPELFTEFFDVVFYDYSKHVVRAKEYDSGNFPNNYHITFSRSET